jgi:hypothetical protein
MSTSFFVNTLRKCGIYVDIPSSTGTQHIPGHFFQEHVFTKLKCVTISIIIVSIQKMAPLLLYLVLNLPNHFDNWTLSCAFNEQR